MNKVVKFTFIQYYILHLKVKKLVAILSIIVYSSVGLGIAINYHYCGRSLTKVSILNFGKRVGCGCNEKDMPMDCCKDHLHYAKADNHKAAQQATIRKVISFAFEFSPDRNYKENLPGVNNFDNYNYSVLYKRSNPRSIFLLNKVFRI